MIEQLMITDKDEKMKNYKFQCFHGIPDYCWVDYDRFKDHKRNIYDLDWNLQPLINTILVLPYYFPLDRKL